MGGWLGQVCIDVEDVDRALGFYAALGLEVRDDVVGHPSYGGRLQLAEQRPFDLGTALWKLYVDTDDIDATFTRATDAGASVESKPERMERWPVTIAFVRDPDGILVELVQRHPWPDEAPSGSPWIGQCCVNVSDIERTVAFYEGLGLQCTSRTEIPQAFEAIVEQPGRGGKLQLAQQKDGAPIRMGALRTLCIETDDPGARRQVVTDPDGYQVELVPRHQEAP